ncbi:protease B [Fulvivirgaceae bacterium PWU5]|uniref:Protease B n=1 Tax=Dawidia cretensis TaxID=2782350 RepID=A0AAP2GQT5_9BACT|nr:M57 family metalloprotease [Dawidia cretensis]MBT1710021.1 protease B [Dawidia cretensis]
MKKYLSITPLLLALLITVDSCQESENEAPIKKSEVSKEVLAKLVELGFDVTDKAPFKFEDGYLVEGDIYLTQADLAEMKPGQSLPTAEQYSTNNLVSGSRNISVYIGTNFSSTYVTALNTAIARYNAEGLRLTFSRTTSSNGATIRITRLSSSQENSGVLGSAGFPTSSGNPYGAIQMSGILQSTYGLSANGIATILAHEMGHCIGLRHTDYFNRAISCGGSASNEGTAGVGANHIPNTPTGATAAARSYMLACTDGSDRPFNSADRIALQYLY